jgi:IS30 family transposase
MAGLVLLNVPCSLAANDTTQFSTDILRFTLLVEVPSPDTVTVLAALSPRVRKFLASLRRFVDLDRGLGIAKHKSFTKATEVNVYFYDPQSLSQRGKNENTKDCYDGTFQEKSTFPAIHKLISTR